MQMQSHCFLSFEKALAFTPLFSCFCNDLFQFIYRNVVSKNKSFHHWS